MLWRRRRSETDRETDDRERRCWPDDDDYDRSEDRPDDDEIRRREVRGRKRGVGVNRPPPRPPFLSYLPPPDGRPTLPTAAMPSSSGLSRGSHPRVMTRGVKEQQER